jgi:hypothetical protein
MTMYHRKIADTKMFLLDRILRKHCFIFILKMRHGGVCEIYTSLYEKNCKYKKKSSIWREMPGKIFYF